MEQDLQARVAARLSEDPAFRERLRNDPKGVLEQELGVTFPASRSVEVHEDSATTAHLILPSQAALSERELQAVAGGLDPVYEEFKAQERRNQGLPDPT